ncbi:hypothetical protein [Acinetobacter ursingii]|uniref:hypothetical protein n=1 Tax=Acinetobacter ursingii TaxID=108980 RepID=UPI00124F8F13|nr:hypothetical protein [Acinetobacter ursingii]
MSKIQKIIIAIASLVIILIPLSYSLQFAYSLELPLSNKQEVWGQMGDFIGGTINPILSFFTILLLIQSLNYQYNANESLKKQLKNSEKIENLRTFENLFFNLVTSQSNLFDKFNIYVSDTQNQTKLLVRAEAVLRIEESIEYLIDKKISIECVANFYEEIDQQYGIFDILRAFYIIVKLVTEQLNDESGFTVDDRQFYYERLINLTNFSHLRLICTAMQFEKASIVEYLKNNHEFLEICKKLDLNFTPYEFR